MIIKNQLLKALVLLIGMIGCMACSEQSEDKDNPPQAGSSNLTVTPGKLNFKAEGGTQELRVKTTYEYFGYDFTADWISADFKDDATYNIITVTAKPNTTSSVRKATFKIIGSNSETGVDETVNITIEQEGKNSSGGGKTFTVSAQGGTIEEGNIKINFPSGTYDGDRQVEIKEIEQGKTALEEEVSSFYEVFMPADSKKPLQISIKSDVKGDNIGFIAHAPGVALHDENRETAYGDIRLQSKYANGTYTATIPSINDSKNPEGLKISFGLVKMSDNTSVSANARSTRSEEDGDIKWHKIWGIYYFSSNRKKVEALIDDAMTQAVKIIKNLGFKVKGDRDIPLDFSIYFTNTNVCGYFIQSRVSDEWSYISLNSSYIFDNIDKNPMEIRRTIIHELFHYFQANYDPASSTSDKCFEGYNEDLFIRNRIYEAGGVWIEKYVDSNKYYDSDWKKDFQYNFIAPYNEGEIAESSDDLKTGTTKEKYATAQHWGYGSAPIFDWFVYKKDASVILELYKEFKKGKVTMFRHWIEDCEKATGVQFHSDFDNYATKMCEGSLVHGISYGSNVDYKPVDKKYGLYDVCKGKWGNWTVDGIKEFKNPVYQYGVRPNLLAPSTNSKDKINLKDKQIRLEQENENLKTKVWFYEEATGKYTYLGEFKKGSDLLIKDEKILNQLLYENDAVNHKAKVLLLGTWMIKQSKVQEESIIKVALVKEPKITKVAITYAYNDTNNENVWCQLPWKSRNDYSSGITEVLQWAPCKAVMNKTDNTITITSSGEMSTEWNKGTQKWDFTFTIDGKNWGLKDYYDIEGSVSFEANEKERDTWSETKTQRKISFRLKKASYVEMDSWDEVKEFKEFGMSIAANQLFEGFTDTWNYEYHKFATENQQEEYKTDSKDYKPKNDASVTFNIQIWEEE